MADKDPIVFSSEITMYVGMTYRLLDRRYTGRKKIRMEGFHSYPNSRNREEIVHHERHIDRANDKYYERVECPVSGKLIHECCEKLSEHRGHGAAKKSKDET